MRTMTKEFKNRVIREESVDTKKYRYVLAEIFGEGFEIHRIELKDLDTTAAYDGWEFVCKV